MEHVDNSTLEDKIRQTIKIGSAFTALESKLFEAEELLEWLIKEPVTIKTNIAYKAICTKIKPNEQYLSDGVHFLVKRPEYAPLAIRLDIDIEIPDNKITTTAPLIAHICEEVANFNESKERQKLMLLMFGESSDMSYTVGNLTVCFQCRVYPHIRLNSDDINRHLVEADWCEKFRYNATLINLILKRIKYLQENAPIYYELTMKEKYKTVIKKLNKDKLLTTISKEDLITVNEKFPNIIDSRILQYGDLAYKILLLDNTAAGYILGFFIQHTIPSEEQLHKAIMKIKDADYESYVNFLKSQNKQSYQIILTATTPIENEKLEYSNETDVLMEDIDNYFPFDIVFYQTGNHIYRFTRPEFKQIMESKKNPWTNDWLPESILSTIISRDRTATELGLPDAIPMFETYKKINDGTWNTMSSTNTEPTPNQEDAHISNANFLALFVSRYGLFHNISFSSNSEENSNSEPNEEF
jgi:hypothetical protein